MNAAQKSSDPKAMADDSILVWFVSLRLKKIKKRSFSGLDLSRVHFILIAADNQAASGAPIEISC